MFRTFIISGCFVIISLSSVYAAELPPLNIKGTYYFSWNRIPLAKLWIATEQNKTDYKFTGALKSSALTNIFRKVKALTTSKGIKRNGTWQALTFDNEARYSNDTKTIKLTFDKSGTLTKRELSHEDDPNYRPRVAKDALKGAITYGNALFVLRQSLHDALQTGQDSFIHYLFDGERLMQVTATINDDAEVEVDHKFVPAYKLSLERKLVSGFTHKEKKKYEEGEPLAYLYLSHDEMLLPIGMEIDMSLGNLRGHWEAE